MSTSVKVSNFSLNKMKISCYFLLFSEVLKTKNPNTLNYLQFFTNERKTLLDAKILRKNCLDFSIV